MNCAQLRFASSTRAQFHNTDASAILTFHDHGPHISARLRCSGPLDEANMDKAVAWAREICASRCSKPVLIATPTGKVLLWPENGRILCERLISRRRARS
jgi:hypothetical protein